MTAAPVAYIRGDDAFGMEQSVLKFAATLGGADGPLCIWRAAEEDAPDAAASGAAARRRERLLAEIEVRLATAPLFGGGTLVVVRQPEALAREGRTREHLIRLVSSVPVGNGLCLVELAAAGARVSPTGTPLRDAVAAAGGSTIDAATPSRAGMESWITQRAAELDMRLGPGAARQLAERVGGFVRESDVDRRRQTELADQELRKLALYRPTAAVSADDVKELVAESIPGSAWAFLDAFASRRPAEAGTLAERLLTDGAPLPVLIGQIHRRLRELIAVRDYTDAGIRGGQLMRALKLQPYRAQKLEEQAARWSADELQAALEGLLDLDLASKGISLDGSTRQMSDARSGLGLQGWLAEAVAFR